MRRRAWKYLVRLICISLGTITVGITLFLFFYVFWKGKNVMSVSFILDNPSGVPVGTAGGIFPALVGSVFSGGLSVLIGGPIGVGAAAYLSFYASCGKVHNIVQASIQCLSGVPSILFGLVAYMLLIYGLGMPRSLLCASIAIASMIIPFVAIRARKIFDEVAQDYMKASVSLGLSKGYTLRRLVLPACFVELLSTIALGMAYGMGATAPILYTGAVMQAGIPEKVTEPFMSLPYHLYMLINNGFSLEYAYGTAFVLMVFLLCIQLLCKLVSYFREGAQWSIRKGKKNDD